MTPENEELLGKTKELLDELHAKSREEVEKKKREKWTTSAGVSLVVIAVLGATAVQRGGSYGSRAALHTNQSIFLQVKVADEWAFYQSKSTKAHMFELGSDLVEHLGPNGEEERRMVEQMQKKQKKYEGEKEEVKKQAEDLERQRDNERSAAEINAEASSRMGRAVTGFQMTIAIASVGLVMKRKILWQLSLLLGALATAWMIWCMLHAPPA